jgi:hypothetical protein
VSELTIDGFVIGNVTYGTDLSINDYSRKDRDAFGNLTIIERGYSNIVNYQLEVLTTRLYQVRDKLAACRATKKTFVVKDETGAQIDGLTVTGYLNSFSLPIDAYTVSACTLEVESEVVTT